MKKERYGLGAMFGLSHQAQDSDLCSVRRQSELSSSRLTMHGRGSKVFGSIRASVALAALGSTGSLLLGILLFVVGMIAIAGVGLAMQSRVSGHLLGWSIDTDCVLGFQESRQRTIA